MPKPPTTPTNCWSIISPRKTAVPHDATGYANNALTAGKRDDGGMIGYGLRLDGTTPVQIPASPSLTIAAGQPMTWSIWARLNDGVNTGVLYSQRDGPNAFTIGLDQGVAYAEIETAGRQNPHQPGAAVTRRLPPDHRDRRRSR